MRESAPAQKEQEHRRQEPRENSDQRAEKRGREKPKASMHRPREKKAINTGHEMKPKAESREREQHAEEKPKASKHGPREKKAISTGQDVKAPLPKRLGQCRTKGGNRGESASRDEDASWDEGMSRRTRTQANQRAVQV
jgi:hypothetical protein